MNLNNIREEDLKAELKRRKEEQKELERLTKHEKTANKIFNEQFGLGYIHEDDEPSPHYWYTEAMRRFINGVHLEFHTGVEEENDKPYNKHILQELRDFYVEQLQEELKTFKDNVDRIVKQNEDIKNDN